MPSDATIQSIAGDASPRTIRLGGFVFGIFLSLALGGLTYVGFSGNGLSTTKAPPEQIYFP